MRLYITIFLIVAATATAQTGDRWRAWAWEIFQFWPFTAALAQHDSIVVVISTLAQVGITSVHFQVDAQYM